MNLLLSKKSNIKKYTSFSNLVILIISLIFALLVGAGLYGYGIDYYGAYIKGFEWNLPRVDIFNYLGFKISTLRIYGFYTGVYVVTFILSLSVGFLIKEHLKSKQSYSLIFFLLIFVITIHTWPIIMSTSNAMRQGLAMSFIFLALTSSINKNYFFMYVFSFVAIFMHKSGIFLCILVIFVVILDKSIETISYKNKVIINFLIGTFLLIFGYYFLSLLLLPGLNTTRMIGKDFSKLFFFISLIYIILSFFFRGVLSNRLNLFTYYYSFISTPFFLTGINWQYERLGMMMIIPYILSYGNIFNKPSYKIYIFSAIIILFLLTIYTGMYSEGLFYRDEYYNPGDPLSN